MPKLSAGLLLYKQTSKGLEIFLVHPGGPFWAKKDVSAWSLPKGEYAQNEDPLTAAKREFSEETGQACPKGDFFDLGQVKYGNKILSAWAINADCDGQSIKSNYFEMEWPPKSGQTQQFAEVDRAGWFTPKVAKTKLVGGQVPFVDRLAEKLNIDANQSDPGEQLSIL